MYASPCEYEVASSWPEAVRLLLEGGEEAKVIAGGQSLVPMMTLRLATPELLVDVTGADRPGISSEEGRLVISALTRHADLEDSPEVNKACPLLAAAASRIGNIRVRHRGTLGGSLAHADPSAELPCVAIALEMTIRALGPQGERRIPAVQFFNTYFTTELREAEVITAIEVPVTPPGTGWSFQELVRRQGDFAIVEVAALVEMEGPLCVGARIVAGGVADRPMDLSEAGSVLFGQKPDEPLATDVARRAMEHVVPSSSVHASAEYRREMVGVLVRRAIIEAARRTEPAS